MSEFSHLIPSNLKELEVRKPSVQGSAYSAAEGRINFHSASARAIDPKADVFDVKLREMAVSSLQSNYFGQSDIGKAVANGVAVMGLAAQRAIGMSDDDFVAYYGGGNYEYLPNGESAYANITDPSLSENWTTEDKEELEMIKHRYRTDKEYKKLVDMISPEKKEERLNKLRQERDISDQALAEHFSQADGFFATGSVFAQTVASYVFNDPVNTASIFFPAARFRKGMALSTGGKFKLGFKQGGKDALPFAATFPAIGAVEEARLLDLGASAAEAQSAYFDRLLEIPAAFGVRALASVAIDLTPAAGRVILGAGGKAINRFRKPPETPETPPDAPTNPPKSTLRVVSENEYEDNNGFIYKHNQQKGNVQVFDPAKPDSPIARIIAAPSADTGQFPKNTKSVSEVFVDLKHQNKGIGKNLYKILLQHDDIGSVKAQGMSENVGKIYRGLGAEETKYTFLAKKRPLDKSATEGSLSAEEIAKRQAAEEAKKQAATDNAIAGQAEETAERTKGIKEISQRLASKKSFTPEEQILIVESINKNIPKEKDRLSTKDLFDKDGVAKIDKFTNAVEGDEGIIGATEIFYDGIYGGDATLKNAFSGGEFAKIIRSKSGAEKIVKANRAVRAAVGLAADLELKLARGGEVTRAEKVKLVTALKDIADKQLIEKLKDGASLLDVMPELVAAANLARAKNSGRAPKTAVSEEEYFPFDLDETKSKESLKQHVETRLPENAKRRGDKPQTDEEKTSVSEIDKQLKVVDENLFAERRAIEKDFSNNLNALNADRQKKYDAIDSQDVEKQQDARKEWTAAANELRKKTDDKLREVGSKYEVSINKMEAQKASLGGDIEQLSFWNQLRRIREKQVATRDGEAKQLRSNRKDFPARTGTPLEENIKKPEDVRIQQSEKAGNERDETSAAGNEKRADSEIDKQFDNGNVEDIETIQRQGLYREIDEGKGKPKKRVLVADVHTKVERLNVGTEASPRSLIRIVFTDNAGTQSKTNLQINGDNQVSIENDTVIIRRAAVDKFEPETPAKGQPKSEHAGKPALRIDTINVEVGGGITFQQRYYLDEAAVKQIDKLQGISEQGTAANISHNLHRPSLRALSENWVMNDTTAFEGDNQLRRVRQNFELIHKCSKGR